MHTPMFRTRAAARVAALPAAAAVVLMVGFGASAAAASPNAAFGFHARGISGAPSGEVTLTGGGAFDPATGFAQAGGGFRCTAQVNQGPLAGCMTGEGVRWDTDALLPAAGFKCTSDPTEAAKSASTDDDTVALRADFYRAGDGIDESFRANVIVSAHDIADDVDGVQNVWIQGVGCAAGVVHFAA